MYVFSHPAQLKLQKAFSKLFSKIWGVVFTPSSLNNLCHHYEEISPSIYLEDGYLGWTPTTSLKHAMEVYRYVNLVIVAFKHIWLALKIHSEVCKYVIILKPPHLYLWTQNSYLSCFAYDICTCISLLLFTMLLSTKFNYDFNSLIMHLRECLFSLFCTCASCEAYS